VDEILKTLVANAPNLIGLVALAWVLWRQNERMLSALLERVAALEVKVQELARHEGECVKPPYIPF